MPARRVLVVSHSCSVPVNQSVYLRLAECGWDVRIVVPNRWRHDFAAGAVPPTALPGLEGALVPVRVLRPGDPARHLYLGRLRRLVDDFRPAVAYVEAETFTPAAYQWARTLGRAGVPFGVSADENLDRRLPAPVLALRRSVLARAAFVAAHSPQAAALVRRWGAAGRVELVPHPVPAAWESDDGSRQPGKTFAIGFAGRLVSQKGIHDLLAAVTRLSRPVKLVIAGSGPLRADVAAASVPVEFVDADHSGMPAAYRRMDVLVLPSRTTTKWAEQFGRVLVEAVLCGVPVVGSDSGAIPWVIESMGGGIVVPEGDADALAEALSRLADSKPLRDRYARSGAERARELFTDVAVAARLSDVLEEVASG